jgi:hypothetical protein
MKPQYFSIETPQESFTFYGTVRAAEPGFTWLCKPDGEEVRKVESRYVKLTTAKTAARIIADQPRQSDKCN